MPTLPATAGRAKPRPPFALSTLPKLPPGGPLVEVAVADLREARRLLRVAIHHLMTETPKRGRMIALRRIRSAQLATEAAHVGLRKAGEASR